MREGDLIFTWFPYDDTMEFKLRPAVVLVKSGPRYVCAPLTSKNKKINWAVPIESWKKSGLLKPCKAKVDTLFTISSDRHYRYIGRLSQKDRKKVFSRFRHFLMETDFPLSDKEDRRVAL